MTWAYIEKRMTPEPNTGCWLWTGRVDRYGYGKICSTTTSREFGAHRVVAELKFGYLGKALVLHACDNPACVNPQHLRLGTQQDNMTDKKVKGRTHEHRPRMSKVERASIEAALGSMTVSNAARSFGRSICTIKRIKRTLTTAQENAS